MEIKFSIFKKTKVLFWAFLLWTFWELFYALIMYLQIKEIPLFAALISSSNFNYAFALLTILIWFICKWIPFEKISKFLFVLFHFFFAMLISALWLFIVIGLWYLTQGKEIIELAHVRDFIGWQFLFGMVQYFLVAGIFYTIIYYRNFKQKQFEEAELKILMRDAELKALKLQMNPHFLFNVLNSINALITQNPSLARKMISRLSEMLRMSLESRDELMISLKEELELAHTYIDIEQIRFEDKMIYREHIDPELLTEPFPAMLLQPLLENAVKHGIANSRSGGIIELTIKNLTTRMRGMVINRSNDKLIPAKNSNGTAIANIRQRLDRLYGDTYTWHIDCSEANIFKVIFELPLT